jgi:hypothetical protein
MVYFQRKRSQRMGKIKNIHPFIIETGHIRKLKGDWWLKW